jgi:hypothetical protein
MKLGISMLVLSAGIFVSCDPATMKSAMGTLGQKTEPSTQEVGMGLKEALQLGVGEGVALLSAKDGYYKSPYKILLPPEARKVSEKLKVIPLYSKLEDVVIEKINRAAEDAALKAKPIFVSAIREISFADAWSILRGGQNAATTYLKDKTYDRLYQEFNPIIITSLDKFEARKYWGDAVNSYNKIPFLKEKANPRLDDYVTKEALNGLFAMVEQKEKDIRENPVARISELLRFVFSRQDKK